MALSNSYDYTSTFTAASLIALALRRLGVYDPAESVDSTEQTNALQVLNLVVKELANKGISVHLRDTMYLFLTSKTTGTYTTSSNYLVTSHNTTQLNGGGSSGASTITVDNDDAISSGDTIIIKLSDGTMQVTTVNGAPAANVVTLTAPLSGDASDDAYVYTFVASTARYTGVIDHVISAYVVRSDSTTLTDNVGGLSTELRVAGDTEYHELSQRLQTGVPSTIHHRRGVTDSTFFVWPVGGQVDVDRIEMVVVKPIMDLDATTNELAIPPALHNALGWQLAAELASEYGIPDGEQRRLWLIADSKLQDFLDANREDASVIFEIGYNG